MGNLCSRRHPKLTLGYWGIRGLGAPLRMMAAYAGAKVEIKNYSAFEEWGADKAELKKTNSLINLPYIKNHDTGALVTQSSACYAYLGRQLGLTPPDTVERQEQVLAQTFDLRTDVMTMVYPFSGKCPTPEDYKKNLPDYLEKKVPVHYEKFEGFLKDDFCAGSSMTTCDFHLFEMIDQHEMMAKRAELPSPVKPFPKLEKFYQKVRALPQLAEYFESDYYKMPVNSPAVPAHFL